MHERVICKLQIFINCLNNNELTNWFLIIKLNFVDRISFLVGGHFFEDTKVILKVEKGCFLYQEIATYFKW